MLVPGGPPASLPITVRNTGNGPSGPVTVTLSTPPGVSAEIPGASGSSTHPASSSGTTSSGAVQARSAASPMSTTPASATPASTTPAAASAQERNASLSPDEPASTQSASASAPADPGIRCSPAGSGISCTSAAGLAPGQSRTFDFRVQASEQARGGEITAHLNGGDTSGVRLAAVPVVVMPSDGVALRESAEDFSPSAYSRLDLDVRNTGNRPGLAVATATLPPGIRAVGMPPECQLHADDRREIRCTAQLRPGERFDGEVWLQDQLEGPAGNGPLLRSGTRWITIPARATLGTAADSDSVHVRQEQSWQDDPSGDPDQPWSSPTPTAPDPPVREHGSDDG